MKKIIYALMATVGGLVLLLAYRTSFGASIPETAAPATAAASTASDGGASGADPSAATAGGSTASGSALTDGTYTGAEAFTRYGAVQVRITVSGGKITAVDVPVYPNGERRDSEINAVAVPRLIAETTAAQSAQIDMVSGATSTSEGYLTSLQSALDRAAS